MTEFKDKLDETVTKFRDQGQLSVNLELLYDYINTMMMKDLHMKSKFRISKDHYMELWNAAKKQYDSE